MISCKKATELISKSLEEPLGVKDEILLKMHLFLCETCDLFRKQTSILRKAVRQSDDEAAGPVMSAEAKEKIRRSISDEK